MSDQLPQHDRVAERELLACCIRDDRLIPVVVSHGVRAEWFCVYAHKKIFEAAVTLSDKGEPADLVTVGHELLKAGAMEEVNAVYFGGLTELTANCPYTPNIRAYVEIIKAYFIDRELINLAGDVAESARNRTVPSTEKLTEAERRILEISELSCGSDTVPIGKGLGEVYAAIDNRRARGDVRFRGLPSGIAPLDTLTGGFKGGSLVIIAARPSLGKTAIAGEFARHGAVEERASILFVSLDRK